MAEHRESVRAPMIAWPYLILAAWAGAMFGVFLTGLLGRGYCWRCWRPNDPEASLYDPREDPELIDYGPDPYDWAVDWEDPA